MNGSAASDNMILIAALVALAILLAGWLVYRRKRSVPLSLKEVLNEIAHERLEHLIIPNGDDGEIQIDHLLLTAKGLLVVEIKDVAGTVFGSNKMENWTVIGEQNRFQISNPQPGLYDRIAAIRHIVREVPVSGRIVFLDGAEFSKGVPEYVCTLAELHGDFSEPDQAAAKVQVEAFRQHWEMLQGNAVATVA